MSRSTLSFSFFFFNDTATTEIYTLSLHDALPICFDQREQHGFYFIDAEEGRWNSGRQENNLGYRPRYKEGRSEEHTSELQSRLHLVCRLLLEKKKKRKYMMCKSVCTSLDDKKWS